MSKKQYIATFSDLHPADETLERIACMKEKKQSIGLRKSVVVAAAVLSILFALGAVAYAATDGEIMNTVAETFDLVVGKVYVLVNGVQVEGELNISEQVNEDGVTVYYVEMDVPAPLENAQMKVKYECVDGVNVKEVDLFLQQEVEIAMQATEE